MSTAIIKTDSSTSLALELTATTPAEMRQSQGALIDWCDRKMTAVQAEAAELAENLAIAIKRKWKSTTLKKHHALAEKRVTFYGKIKAALQAGYCIVPNFQISLFAVRTDREKPARAYTVSGYYNEPTGHFAQEHAKQLEVGQGEYQNPNVPQQFEHTETKKDQNGNDRRFYGLWSEDFDEIEFPLNMAKPAIMEATGQAMAEKIFDELGVLPDPRRKADPVILGTIIDPRSTTYNKRVVSFVVAWHLNVRDL